METRRHKALKGRQDHRQGCKPLQRMAATLAPKGRQSVLPPLRGLGYHTAFSRGFASLHHLPVIFSGLRPYLRNLNKKLIVNGDILCVLSVLRVLKSYQVICNYSVIIT